MDNIEIKLKLLIDAASKKAKLLEQIYNITYNQETLCLSDISEAEKAVLIKEAVDEKQKIIDKIAGIDNAFISSFESFGGQLNKNKDKYKDELLALQDMIREVTDIDVKIRVMEERNRRRFSSTLSTPKISGLKASREYMIKQYKKNVEK